jgi:hypothetical protein
MEDNSLTQQIVATATLPAAGQWVYSGGDTPLYKLPDLLLVCTFLLFSLLFVVLKFQNENSTILFFKEIFNIKIIA